MNVVANPARPPEAASLYSSLKKARIRPAFADRISVFIRNSVQTGRNLLLEASNPKQVELGQFTQSSGSAATTTAGGEDEGSGPDSTEDQGQDCDEREGAVIYTRVSSNEQASDGRGLDTQEDTLRSIVSDMDGVYLYADPVADEGESGVDFGRNGLEQIMLLAENDEVSYLFVDNIDRIGRDAIDTLVTIKILREEHDVTIMRRREEFDIRRPSGLMKTAVTAVMAELGTIRRARSATLSKISAFMNDDKWFSWFKTTPFGYQKDGDWIKPDESATEIVKEIYETFLRVEKYAETARQINKKYGREIAQKLGPRSSKEDIGPLSETHVKSILTRPCYIGQPTLDTKGFESYDDQPQKDAPRLAIVSEDTYDRAQEVAGEIKRQYSSTKDPDSMLSEYVENYGAFTVASACREIRVVCPECGSMMRADGEMKFDRNGSQVISHMFECTGEDCDNEERWPGKGDVERMRLLAEAHEMDLI